MVSITEMFRCTCNFMLLIVGSASLQIISGLLHYFGNSLIKAFNYCLPGIHNFQVLVHYFIKSLLVKLLQYTCNKQNEVLIVKQNWKYTFIITPSIVFFANPATTLTSTPPVPAIIPVTAAIADVRLGKRMWLVHVHVLMWQGNLVTRNVLIIVSYH